MPTLAAEPSMYPEDLLYQSAEAAPERRWWVVHTNPRQEKSLARHLYAKQVPFYLPLIPKLRINRGRKIKSYLPVFGGYLFLFGNDYECMTALESNRVVKLLPVPGVEEMSLDLRNIEALIKANAPLTVEGRLAPGVKVRVKSGALMGLEGVILSRRGENRLLIAVRFLQQGVSVMIEDFLVEAA